MNKDMNLEKWRDFLSTLELSGGASPLETEKDIEAFESTTRILLPFSFKEYCLVFGSGTIGDELSIYGPSRVNGEFGLIELALKSLPNFKETVAFEIQSILGGDSSGDVGRLRFIEKMLNNCLPFATTPGAEIFVWHLETYSESDKSYDIYRVSLDSVEESGSVGRDFFKFITGFIIALEHGDIEEVGEENILLLPSRRKFYRFEHDLNPPRT